MPDVGELRQFCSGFDAVFANENTHDVAVRAAGCAIELTDQVSCESCKAVGGALDDVRSTMSQP